MNDTTFHLLFFLGFPFFGFDSWGNERKKKREKNPFHFCLSNCFHVYLYLSEKEANGFWFWF